ncbi:MAG: MFS transporter, partial [Actinomycetota bacterium]|nr:MFS transporter [Actinomycetota bacterium]
MTLRIFPGWWVVAAVFLVLSAASGLIFYGLAVYLDALTDEQPFSTTSVSLATSVFFIVAGVAGRVIAPIIETRDIRLVIALGALLGGASLAVLGTVDSLVELYTVYIVLALGFAMAGVLPATTLVTRWFHGRRALALAIASTGLSVGGLTYTQFAAWLIGDRSLADAAPILGLVYVISILATLPLLIPSPAHRGLEPEGAENPANDGSVDGIDYDTAIRTRFFVVVLIGFVLAMGAQVGGLSQIANLGSERVDSSTGALAVSAIAVGSATGRLVGGFIADRLPLVTFTIVLAFVQGITLIGIAFADGRIALVVVAFCFGTTIGNLLMLQPLLIASAFGVTAYPRIFAFQQLIITVGIAGGPL